jgi:predicted esterase
VWVVLHGFGHLAHRFIRWFAPAATDARLIVAPEALNRYYTDHHARRVGATWMTSEDREAEIADYVGYLDLVLADVRAAMAPDVAVEVHGFSQGATTACRWVALGRVRPRRLVVWGGGVPPDLDLGQHGAALARAQLTLVIGDQDEFISEEKVRAETDRLNAAGVRFELQRFQGGHLVPAQEVVRLAGPALGGGPASAT